jgi:hypothetical protein
MEAAIVSKSGHIDIATPWLKKWVMSNEAA